MITIPDQGLVDFLTLNELFRSRVMDAPARVFIHFEDRSWTFREIDLLSNRVAHSLIDKGIGKGDVVGTISTNNIESLVIWLGCLKIGAIWTGLNTGLIGDDLVYTMNNTTARIWFLENEFKDNVAAVKGRLQYTKSMWFLGENDSDRSFQAFLLPNEAAVEFEPLLYDPAAIVYTGGTTGLPKGVVLPHFAYICSAYRYRTFHRANAEDRHLTVLQFYHTGGQQMGIWGPMLSDIETVALKRFSASRYWGQVKKFRATLLDPMGAMYTILLKQPEKEDDGDRPRKIMWGVTGSMPEQIVSEFQRRFNFEFMGIYALSESGGIALIHESPEDRRHGSNGRDRGWAEIGIVSENDELLPPGQVGEIVLRPKVPFSFMLGYWKYEEKTLETFRNLWLHTGDLGYLDEDGYLYFKGRQAHWLRRRSENISAYEIEDILNQHPSISSAVVVGVPSELGEEEVKAYIQLNEGETADPINIVDWCKSRMAKFKIPRYIEFVKDFPRSRTKEEIERFKLREMGIGGAWDREKVGS